MNWLSAHGPKLQTARLARVRDRVHNKLTTPMINDTAAGSGTALYPNKLVVLTVSPSACVTRAEKP